MDLVYHRWLNSKYSQKGAYLNTGKGWKSAPHYTPPFHIAADRHGDLGTRFIDLNGDGKMDYVYHRWLNSKYQQKGAYLNTGSGWKSAPKYTPPFHIAADGHGDLGARFIRLNNDDRMDLVYHRWLNGDNQQKGAYVNLDFMGEHLESFNAAPPSAFDVCPVSDVTNVLEPRKKPRDGQ